MNIYINARFLTQSITGVQRYAVEVVRQLDELLEQRVIDPQQYSFTMLCPEQGLQDQQPPAYKHIRLKKVGRLKGHAWEQIELPWYARKGLLVNLCNTGPLMKRNQIATVHDAAVFAHPEAFTFAFRNAYRVILIALGKQAKMVVTVSVFSKSELVRYCGMDERKLRVVSLGLEHMERITPDYRIYEKHGLSAQGYVFAVSSRNPYKNFESIRKAITWLGERPYDIVVAGAMNDKVFGNSVDTTSDGVKWIGYVTDGELKALFEGAACFLFPSYYEGFGLPPLEAMACGVPVIVSDAASLPEVCADAGLYFNPSNSQELAGKIALVMNDRQLRDSLRTRGYERAASFSWENCARQTLEVIREVAER